MDGATHVQAFLKASGIWLKFAFVLQILEQISQASFQGRASDRFCRDKTNSFLTPGGTGMNSQRLWNSKSSVCQSWLKSCQNEVINLEPRRLLRQAPVSWWKYSSCSSISVKSQSHMPSGCSAVETASSKMCEQWVPHVFQLLATQACSVSQTICRFGRGLARDKCFSTYCRPGNVFYRAELHNLKTADGHVLVSL